MRQPIGLFHDTASNEPRSGWWKEFESRGARAFDMMLDREHRAERATNDRDREFWRAAAEYWRESALTWWKFAADEVAL